MNKNKRKYILVYWAVYFFSIPAIFFMIRRADFLITNPDEVDYIYQSKRDWLEDLYYLWNYGKDFLFTLVILKLLPEKQKWIIQPLFYYCSILLLWGATNPLTSLDINHPIPAIILMGVLLLGATIWLSIDLKVNPIGED